MCTAKATLAASAREDPTRWRSVALTHPFSSLPPSLPRLHTENNNNSWAAPPPIAAAAAQQQQQLSPLAALMADDYLFADADADGRVTAAELARAAERTGRDAGLPSLPEGAASFSARLYDLDGDGALTTDELLRAMALDSAVDPDAGALDAGVLSVFDHDRSGAVSASEWRTALGPVQGGDAVADAVFARADRLTDSRGQLAPEALAAALTAMREVLLGY